MDPYGGQPSPRRVPPHGNGHPTPPMRGASGSPSAHGTPDPARLTQPGGSMTRAELFEDEKQRIMKTCFSKRDDKGALLQSYITHIRVEEDAMHPSDPPPANADPQYKKARIIMVAVKNTGRVYMHKARENSDTTFQIGKTWPLEELGEIESFSPDAQRPPEEAARAQLGGSSGLVISMNKPYYWKAMTQKEKEFFIASLIKIYRKYTSGQVPKLKGFSPREEVEILGASQAPPGTRPPAPQPSGLLPGGPPPPIRPDTGRSSPGLSSDRPALRGHRPSDISVDSSMRSVSNDSSTPTQRPPSPLRHRNIVPGAVDRSETPPGGSQAGPGHRHRPPPLQDNGQLRAAPSREGMNDRRLQTPGLPPARLSPRPSNSNFARLSPGPPPEGPLRSPQYPPAQSTGSPEPLRQFHKGGAPSDALSGAIAATKRMRSPVSPVSPYSQPETASTNGVSGPMAPSGAQQVLPERRRPPLDEPGMGRSTPDSDVDAVPKPLKSKSILPAASAPPPPRSYPEPKLPTATTMDPPRMPGSFDSPAATPPPMETSGRGTPQQNVDGPVPFAPPPPIGGASSRPSTPQGQVASAIKSKTASPAPLNTSMTTSPSNKAEQQPTSAEPPEVTSPTSATRSKNWNKAFNAANTAAKLTAFKPRVGGAGDKLFAKKKDNGEPDGITGVVPAPRTPMPRTDGSMASQMDRGGSHSASNSASRNGLNGVDSVPRASTGDVGRELLVEEEPAKPSLPTKFEESLAVLGIDPALLSGRGQEYEATLANFGWTDNILHTRTIENLETSLRKEVGKLEAGSWLGYSDSKDERIEDFEKMLDRAIAECDEMEGLLTLYGVELSTLNEEISYIETQSGGIQVQTANQKLLQKELQDLIKSQGSA